MNDVKAETLAQLDVLIKKGRELTASFEYFPEPTIDRMSGFYSEVPEIELRAFSTSALTTIDRMVGRESDYYNVPESALSGSLRGSKYLIFRHNRQPYSPARCSCSWTAAIT